VNHSNDLTMCYRYCVKIVQGCLVIVISATGFTVFNAGRYF